MQDKKHLLEVYKRENEKGSKPKLKKHKKEYIENSFISKIKMNLGKGIALNREKPIL